MPHGNPAAEVEDSLHLEGEGLLATFVGIRDIAGKSPQALTDEHLPNRLLYEERCGLKPNPEATMGHLGSPCSRRLGVANGTLVGARAPRWRCKHSCPSLWCVLVILLFPLSVSAQSQPTSQMVFAMGLSSFDFAGTGTGIVSAARFEWLVGRSVPIEVGLTGFVDPPAGQRGYFLPEAGLHLRWTGTRAAAYLGAGAGLGIALHGGGDIGPTVHGAAGLRIRVARATQLQLELRARAVGPSGGHTTDITLGFVRPTRR